MRRHLAHARAALPFTLPYALIATVFVIVHVFDSLRWLGPAIGFILIPALDVVVGNNERNPTAAEETDRDRAFIFRALLLGWLPVQLGLTALGLFLVVNQEVPIAIAALLGIPLGLSNGGIGITVAHELGHRKTKIDRGAARILLASVLYGHFIVEHNTGHHARVGTPDDPASARIHESVYAFFLRTVPGQFASAWRIENARCRRASGRALHPRNAMIWICASQFAIVVAIASTLGPSALMYFLVQAVFAFLLLEVINYIEHYGLVRDEVKPGVYEKVRPRHSWNAPQRVTNALLFQLQRHSDHHANARRRYQVLRHMPEAPQLPAGYPTMVLLALVPPAWFAIMTPRAIAARRA